MPTPPTAPAAVAPQAATRITELGLRAEVDRMTEHARQHPPDLVRLEVVLAEHRETAPRHWRAAIIHAYYALRPPALFASAADARRDETLPPTPSPCATSYASTSSTTRPWTSVSRKSRPAWRK